MRGGEAARRRDGRHAMRCPAPHGIAMGGGTRARRGVEMALHGHVPSVPLAAGSRPGVDPAR